MLQMNATQLLMPDDSVDFVYSVSSIEHFGGLRVALAHVREAARVLKPGGVLAFSTEFVLQSGRPRASARFETAFSRATRWNG